MVLQMILLGRLALLVEDIKIDKTQYITMDKDLLKKILENKDKKIICLISQPMLRNKLSEK